MDYNTGTTICVIIVMVTLEIDMLRGATYYAYHHCYQEGGYCSTNDLSCNDGFVIDIIWSWIGRSDYWELDPTRTNCSVTDTSCYMTIDEPVDLCKGYQSCGLNTCSNYTRQYIPCLGTDRTNFLRINYTCVEDVSWSINATTEQSDSSSEDLTTANPDNVSTQTYTSVPDDVSWSINATTEQSDSSSEADHTVVIILCTFGGIIILASIVVAITVISSRRINKTGDVASDNNSEAVDEPPKDYYDIETLKKTINSSENLASSKHPRAASSFIGTDLIENVTYLSTEQKHNNKVINKHRETDEPITKATDNKHIERFEEPPEDYEQIATINNKSNVYMKDVMINSGTSSVKSNPRAVKCFMGSDLVDNLRYVSADRKHANNVMNAYEDIDQPTRVAEGRNYHKDFRLTRLERFKVEPSTAKHKQVSTHPSSRINDVRARRYELAKSRDIVTSYRTHTPIGGQTPTDYNINWKEIRRNAPKAQELQQFEIGPLRDPYRSDWKLPRL